MSKSLLFLILSILSLIMVIYIFSLNKILKSRKSSLENTIIFIFIPLFFIFSFFSYRSFTSSLKFNRNTLYAAVKDLNQGNYDKAMKKADTILAENPKNLEAVEIKSLADSLAGNYKSAEVTALEYLINHKTSSKDKQRIEKLVKVADIGQGTVDVNTVEKLISSPATNEFDELTQETKNFNIKKISTEILQASVSKSLPNKTEMTKLDKIAEIENALENSGDIQKAREDVVKLAAENENDLDVKKLEVKVMVKAGDINEATKVAKEIVNLDGSVENKFLLADLYAQIAREYINSKSRPPQEMITDDKGQVDPEIEKLDKKIQKLRQEINTNQQEISTAKSQKDAYKLKIKCDKLQNDITELEKKISTIPVIRMINFIQAARPTIGNNKFLFDLQLAKLYYAADDKDKAKEKLKSAISKVEHSDYQTPVTNSLKDIKALYEQSSSLMDDSRLAPKVTELVDNLGNGNLPITENSLTDEYRNFIISYLKYSKTEIFISRIDKSKFPHVTAYVNVGANKQGIFGFRSDYGQKDFSLEDTSIFIKNFNLSHNLNKDVDICLVFDRSGSMQNRPIADAKAAGINFIQNTEKNQRVSVVSFNTTANRDCELTNEKTTLENSINRITANGGTNISGGLNAALDMLQGSVSSKAVILLSDGIDENAESGALDKTINTAKSIGISVYTVGLGDCDDTYLNKIAESTGGKYFKASSTAELVDIYSIVQKYITNNYIVEYDVTDNADIMARNLTVKLNNVEGQGSRDYSLSDPGENTNGTIEANTITGDASAPDSFVLTSVTEGCFSGAQVKTGMTVEINGCNIPKGIKIKFGEKYSPSVTVVNDHQINAKLPSDLIEGDYDITGITPDNKISKLDNAICISKNGTLSTIQVGDLVVKANSISRVNMTRFIAKGNVRINNVLRVAGDLDITALNPGSKKDTFTSGDIRGTSKLYVSFNNSNNSFVHQTLNGREFLVSNDGFYISSREKSKGRSQLMRNNPLAINVIVFNLEIGSLYVVEDGVEFTAVKFGLNDLGGKYDKNTEPNKQNVITSYMNSFKCFPMEAELKFKVTDKDLLVRGATKLKLGGKDGLKLPYLSILPIQQAGFTIDTIGPVRKLEVTGKCGLPFAKITGLDFYYSAYKNDFKLPDEIRLKLKAGDGFPLGSQFVRLTSFGAGAGTLYDVIKSNNWRKATAIGICDIAVKASPVKIPYIGNVDILSLSDLKLSGKLDFTKFSLGGKVKFLGFQLQEFSAILDGSNGTSFIATSKGGINLDMLIADFGVNGEFVFSFTNDGILAQNSGEVYFNNKWKHENYKGTGSCRFTYNSDITTFTLTGTANNNVKRFRIAMDNHENFLNLKKKFQVECEL